MCSPGTRRSADRPAKCPEEAGVQAFGREPHKIRRLEGHPDDRDTYPARRAVQVHADHERKQHEAECQDEQHHGKAHIALVVDPVDEPHDHEADGDEFELVEEVMCGVAPGIFVGHRRSRGIDHQQRNDGQ